MSYHVFDQIKQGLIVSCQTGDNPEFDDSQSMVQFARAAMNGGAVAIRSEGSEVIQSILKQVDLPMIGLMKGKFPDGSVRITRSFSEIETLLDLGVSIVAVDGTDRVWDGLSGPLLIEEMKKRYDIPVMADISTYEDAKRVVEAGADCLSTTLAGYTPETAKRKTLGPDFNLLNKLTIHFDLPVIAEGRYNSPEWAAQALEYGAWAVVVGSAITRPRLITSWFRDAIEEGRKNQN